MGRRVIKMNWHDILKAPPIRNPRESEFSNNVNDDLSRAEYVDLFREKVDPVIERQGRLKMDYADVKLTDLKMSEKKAAEVARELYEGKGYGAIFADDAVLTFKLKGEGKI